jgi:hypothetical protein
MNSGSPSGLTTVLVSPPRGSIILDPEGASLLIVKCHGQCVELGARFELHRCGMVSWCTSPIRIVAGTNHNHFYNEKYEFVRALIAPRSARAL